MLVRRERTGDVDAVRGVVRAAFARAGAAAPGPPEVGLLDDLRGDPGWLPALSLVAAGPQTGEVVGHVVGTRGRLDDRPALGLGPLAVRPDNQERGVGSALMHAVLAAAEALDETLVALLGEPGFYARFGFRPAREYGIVPPEPSWGDDFQVRPLTTPVARGGRFSYATPFARL